MLIAVIAATAGFIFGVLVCDAADAYKYQEEHDK